MEDFKNNFQMANSAPVYKNKDIVTYFFEKLEDSRIQGLRKVSASRFTQ